MSYLFSEYKLLNFSGGGKPPEKPSGAAVEKAEKPSKAEKKQDVTAGTRDALRGLARATTLDALKQNQNYPTDLVNLFKAILSDQVSVEEIKSGAARKRAGETENIKAYHHYEKLMKMFTIKGKDSKGDFFHIDYRGPKSLKINDKFEMGLGLHNLLPPKYEEGNLVRKDGSTSVIKRMIGGRGPGYYSNEGGSWVYAATYTGDRFYPTKIAANENADNLKKQVNDERDYYKQGKRVGPAVGGGGRTSTDQPRISTYSTGSGKIGPEQTPYNPDASTQELINRGSTPFRVSVGDYIPPETLRWYNSERREAYRLGRMSIQQRLEILNQRYGLRDGMEYAAKMCNVSEKNMKFFLAYNDAVLRVESNYNVFAVNKRNVPGGGAEIALSSAAGEYQILNSTYNGTRRRWFDSESKKGRAFQGIAERRGGVNLEMLRQVPFNAPRPELLTPRQRAIFHNFYAFSQSRMLRGVVSLDNIFDNIRQTDGRMRRSWISLMYTYWRNGHGGAKPFVRNIKDGIPLPQTKEEARDYFENHLRPSDWQRKRGFNDFWALVRTFNKFADRFDKNLQELG